MTYTLSKSKLQSYHQCKKKLWLEISQPSLAKIDEAQQLILDRGTAFGEAVRGCFEHGDLVKAKSAKEAIQETAVILQSFASGAKRVPIFEAAFAYKGVIVRADILEPLQDGTWKLIEVKSGTIKPGQGVKAHYLRDAATQALIVERSGSGIHISSICLGVPDATFVYAGPMNLMGILIIRDITAEAKALFGDIEACILPASHIAQQTEAPTISVGSHCKAPHACGFATYCSGTQLNSTETFIIPVWHLSKDPLTNIVQKLLPSHRDLAEVDNADLDKPIQLKMKEVACGKAYYLDPKLNEFLSTQPFPRYFLDYETNNAPLPLWVGTHPGESVPFQFSVHKWPALHAPLEHFEFIASTNADPRPALAQALIEALNTPGPVFAWNGNGTEGPITEKLCSYYPAGEAALRRIASSCRINDPLVKFRKWFYVPQMGGDWGLKSVARSILPTNPYSSLAIKNGVDAMKGYEKYLEMPAGPDRAKLESDLLAYCGVDTSVMVDIWKAIQSMPVSP